MLGHEIVTPPKTSSKTLSSIENSIQNDINKAASDVAKELNIHDFYSVHILDFCEVCFTLPLFRSSKNAEEPHTDIISVNRVTTRPRLSPTKPPLRLRM